MTWGEPLPNSRMLEKYQEICEKLFGEEDSDDCTHEEVMEQLELAMDCLRYVEDTSLWKKVHNIKYGGE